MPLRNKSCITTDTLLADTGASVICAWLLISLVTPSIVARLASKNFSGVRVFALSRIKFSRTCRSSRATRREVASPPPSDIRRKALAAASKLIPSLPAICSMRSLLSLEKVLSTNPFAVKSAPFPVALASNNRMLVPEVLISPRAYKAAASSLNSSPDLGLLPWSTRSFRAPIRAPSNCPSCVVSKPHASTCFLICFHASVENRAASCSFCSTLASSSFLPISLSLSTS